MNNFEKRKFLDYLEKLLPVTNTNSYTFDTVFEFFTQEFNVNPQDFSDVDEDNNLQLDSKKSREKFAKEMKNIIKKLKKKITPKNTRLEKQLLIIKDIFSLDENEYEIFIYLAFKEINNIFDKFFDSLQNQSLNTFVRHYLNLRMGKKERLLEKLQQRNLTKWRSSETLNNRFLKILDNPSCNTVDKIASSLLGNKEKANLKQEDFKHIKDQDKVINILSKAVEQKRKGINILLYGGVGTGKTEFSKLIANKAKISMYAVNTVKDGIREAEREDRLLNLSSKQYLLRNHGNACILFDEGEDVMNNLGRTSSKGYLNNLLENTCVPIIWTTNNIYDVDPAFLRRMTYCIEFKKLSEENRLNIWNRILKKNKFKVDSNKIIELNKNYDIPPSLISNAIINTKMIGGNEDDFESFIENVAKVVTKKKCVKNKKEFEMKDYNDCLVNSDINIHNLTDKIKNSGKLNFSLCLYGEPGTGKSLYARYLAKQLGCEVILKRASDLMSKWVGETEQNIAAAFEEAKTKKAMLIFDEADSFLQNRNNANASWEVSQVNEMLTWMESHEYPFVCTTNLLDTLDEASLRRFTFKIRFDFLNPEQVNQAIEHFFGIKDVNTNIKGLTAGDFATVKKKTDFLGINDLNEIVAMLQDEVKVKKSKTLQNTIGF